MTQVDPGFVYKISALNVNGNQILDDSRWAGCLLRRGWNVGHALGGGSEASGAIL